MIKILLTKHRSLWLVGLILTLIGGTAVVWHLRSDTTDTPQVQWLRVEPQLLENHLGLVGRIQAVTQRTLAAPFEGIINDVLVTEGQHVEKGQVLLTLDTAQFDIQIRQALTELLKAKQAEQDLQHWEQGQEVGRARRGLINVQLSLNNIEASLKDTRSLYERGIVARMEVDTLEQQAKTQRLDLAAAKAELQATLDKGSGEERQIAGMELENAQTRYDALVKLRAQQVIRAPFAGIVVRPTTPENSKQLRLQSGMQAVKGMPLFDLINPDRIQAVASVEEADLYQLHEGMPVQITGEGFAGLTLTGSIKTIGVQGRAVESEGAGARYDVLISIDDLPPALRQRIRLGMSAQLAVVTYRNDRGFAIPAEALRVDKSGNNYVIFRTNSDSTPQYRNVTPERAVPQGVEVSGLLAGYIEIVNNRK